ncbi:TM2 domain-containing protein [Hymenobacter sp. BT175]|uniref:TM2 domain-containing protein n=1 Tax=Hymenobacter translucens TaxID=2886507 RepID=UPI001D0E2103|nr:TM2 domain-containing protein [Hymenobacter translucens]MCC2546883.1 TM2 domain-containing protein [Hymenobacter translucens]
MKKFYTYCSVALLSAATLSSCSRSNYAFQPSGPAYHATVTPAAPAPAVSEATASASAAEEAPVATETPAKAAAKALAAPAAKSVETKAQVVKKAVVASESASSKVEAKQLLKQVKKATAKAPAGTTAEGKSQLIALILALLVGSFGVHRFYLGYTGRGILLLCLTLFGWILFGLGPLVAFVMAIIDAVNIYQGELKPANGDYTEKLNDSSSSSKSDTKTDSKKK